MKKILAASMIIAALLLGPGALTAPRPASADVAVSISYFYDSLAPYGSWIDESPYGWCWVPAHVSYGWRPYSDGYWAYSDYGWTWVSYEPWGWAPYHYGRWFFDADYGWVWVPGTVWAPAWVAWRESDDWIGWAPLPPVGSWETSFVVGPAVAERIPAERWCFVPTRRLVEHHVSSWVAPVARNVSLIGETRNATLFSQRGGHPVNRGFDPALYQRATGRSVPRVHAVFASSPAGGSGRRVGSDRIAFFGPNVRNARGAAPRADVRMGPQQAQRIREQRAREPAMSVARRVETGPSWRPTGARETGRGVTNRGRPVFQNSSAEGRSRGFEPAPQRVVRPEPPAPQPQVQRQWRGGPVRSDVGHGASRGNRAAEPAPSVERSRRSAPAGSQENPRSQGRGGQPQQKEHGKGYDRGDG